DWGVDFARFQIRLRESVKTNSRRVEMGKALAVGAAVAVALAVAGTALANHAWGNYHWARSTNPFTLQVGSNVNSGWDGYLNTAVSDWAASDVLDLNKVAGNGTGSTCSPTSGRIIVCNGAYG